MASHSRQTDAEPVSLEMVPCTTAGERQPEGAQGAAGHWIPKSVQPIKMPRLHTEDMHGLLYACHTSQTDNTVKMPSGVCTACPLPSLTLDLVKLFLKAEC